MNNHSSKNISTLIWRSVIQAIILAVLAGFFLSLVYSLLDHYKEKRRHTQQLAALLAISASKADSADVVAEQVRFLLKHEPSIQSIFFYSTPQPLDNINQSRADWKNALFTNTVSFNYPVTSNYIDADSTLDALNAGQRSAADLSSSIIEAPTTNSTIQNSALVGYINITLDVNTLRLRWIQSNLLLWLLITVLTIFWVMYVLRKLNWPVRDIEALTEVCDTVIKTPELEQLPVIPQRFNFQELMQIKRAFIVLFNRLQKVKKDYEALAAFEQQLHKKDISLDVQLHNFQSMITHELKTSLNAIVGGLQLLDPDSLDGEQKDAVQIISNGSDKLVLSLEQIIQLNQIQKGQMSINCSEFNPLQLIADLLAKFEPIAQQKDLVLISQVHHIDYNLEGDAEKIQQILSILLSNAIKFTPAGQITITSQLTHFDKSNRWQISVKDTGIGIDDNHIEDIFNPFFQVDSSQTRQYEGSGVGLPVVKQIAQLMGATIDVESTLGVGTQFALTIAMPNQHQSRQPHLLDKLTVIYYYYNETGFLANELERLGATVRYHQHEQPVIADINREKIDMVMFAEDVSPNKAESLAKRIRRSESEHRALLVYWYPPHRARYVNSFEHGLKAAGIDYCYSATYKDKGLSDLLKRWLVWT
ncbi:sensor histidine kinase [Psychrobacter vallis]|uniref:sensor histidine kinase n=1 Tax=Psychrobacter vallis TaxID=248451 RepID=UPI001919DC8D|nr:HAMP domain-containing sensor histidine kinase [Psychrobacter vallis]